MNETPEKELNADEAEQVAKITRPEPGHPYPNIENPRARLGNTIHSPHWVLIHAPNAKWKNGHGNTEFWNRAARRHLVYEKAPKK